MFNSLKSAENAQFGTYLTCKCNLRDDINFTPSKSKLVGRKKELSLFRYGSVHNANIVVYQGEKTSFFTNRKCVLTREVLIVLRKICLPTTFFIIIKTINYIFPFIPLFTCSHIIVVCGERIHCSM